MNKSNAQQRFTPIAGLALAFFASVDIWLDFNNSVRKKFCIFVWSVFAAATGVSRDTLAIRLKIRMKRTTIFQYIFFIILINFAGYYLSQIVQKLVNEHNGKADLIVMTFGLIGVLIFVIHFVKFARNKSWKIFCGGILLFANVFFWVNTLNKIECFQCSHM